MIPNARLSSDDFQRLALGKESSKQAVSALIRSIATLTHRTFQPFHAARHSISGTGRGATITTNAVTNAVDSALVYFQNELGGGVNE